jgi:hypothetical protein
MKAHLQRKRLSEFGNYWAGPASAGDTGVTRRISLGAGVFVL